MHKLSGVRKPGKEDTQVGTEVTEGSTEDAYAALAPDPIAPTNGASRERDWFTEFSDESQEPAEKSRVWRALGETLKDEDR